MPIASWPSATTVAIERTGGSPLKLWDADRGVSRAVQVKPGFARCIAVSPDGARYAIANHDASIRIWDFETSHLIREIPPETDRAPCLLSFSPDGAWVASGGEDGIVRVWDAASGRLLRTIRGPEGAIRALAFRPEGLRVVTVGRDPLLSAPRGAPANNRRVPVNALVVWDAGPVS